jgi:hypothetical protein
MRAWNRLNAVNRPGQLFAWGEPPPGTGDDVAARQLIEDRAAVRRESRPCAIRVGGRDNDPLLFFSMNIG